jgi:importin subunit beta-1
MKSGNKGQLLLPYVPSVLDLIHRTLMDEDRTENVFKLSMGLIGDIADTFPNGEISQHLLSDWIVGQLIKAKGRGQSAETKRTMKWAREVSLLCYRPVMESNTNTQQSRWSNEPLAK